MKIEFTRQPSREHADALLVALAIIESTAVVSISMRLPGVE
jgi:hypothetical protein